MDNTRCFYQEKQSSIATRNLDFSLSRGEFINYFDGDDYLIDPDELRIKLSYLMSAHYGGDCTWGF